MATVMELIILKSHELFGFIAAIVCGMITYIVSLMVVESFEEEDLALLIQIRTVLPGKTKWIIDILYSLLLHFKDIDINKGADH